jgi:hypothetical protein
MTDNRHFYRDQPCLPSFEIAVDTRLHVDVPDDWWIVIADVSDSTEAIAWGAYKHVNTVGVACIAAVSNIDRSIELPYIFGGDGATFAIPDILIERAIVALRGAQQLSIKQFGLHLRAGLVRVGDLKQLGLWVHVGKVRISETASQPAFSGRGWEEAERRIKSGEKEGVLRVQQADGKAEASFEGFECRWQNVPSFQDHKLSLIIVATSSDNSRNQATYLRVLDQISTIFGDVAQHHPLRAERLQLSISPRLLANEWRVRASQFGLWRRLRYFLNMIFLNAAGRYLFTRNLDTPSTQWSRYRGDMVDNTDFRKFDGALRMLIDATDNQTESLLHWLETERNAGALIFGTNQSKQALITCLVESYAGKHVHFVDGSDGGYALAARQLKRQLAEINTQRDIVAQIVAH